MTGVSIFNIPHILENIGLYLDRRDLASCALVNKTFNEEFKRLLWRELTFAMRSSRKDSLRIHPMQRRMILANSRYIRSLDLHSHLKREHMLGLLMSSVRRLTELSTQVSLARKNGDTLFLNILKLATLNKDLQQWSIFSQADFSPNAFRQLTDAFSETSRLTTLHIGFACSPRRGWLKRVLQSLPQTLKSLDVRWARLDEDLNSDHYPAQDWPEAYPCLESTDFAITLMTEDQSAFTQFLARCRVLKRFRFPTMADPDDLSPLMTFLGTQKFFPTLEALDFGVIVQIERDDWDRILHLMKGRIKSIATCLSFNIPSTKSFIHAMTRQWPDTLERIEIGQPLNITGSDIHLILTSCRKLKRLDCLHTKVVWPMSGRPTHPDAYPGPDTMMISNENSGHDGGMVSNWACLELEELKILFRDGRRAQDGPGLEEESTVMAIKYIYSQLGRLTKLRELTLGWKTTMTFEKCANLDMSLSSGLGLMNNLKALRVLDVNYIYRIKLGLEEAKWMTENWPSLTKVRGLEYQVDDMEKGGDLPNCIVWLRQNDLIIE